MEEFRSTEILDKEIQEDARKKAERLLKNAETDGRKILEETENRIEKAMTGKAEQYNARIAAHKNDIDAALPLEKERFLVSFENNAVEGAVTEYMNALSEEKRLVLLENLVARYVAAFEDKPIMVTYQGFERKKIEMLVKKTFNVKTEIEFEELSAKQSVGTDSGMILETRDKAIRCRVTVMEIMNELLDVQRFELANALFCGRLG